MTPSRLRELSRAASPAPWRCEPNGSGSYGHPRDCPTYIRDNPPGDSDGYVVAAVVAECVPQHDANARLVVALRNDAEKYADLRDAVKEARDAFNAPWHSVPDMERVRYLALTKAFAALAALDGSAP